MKLSKEVQSQVLRLFSGPFVRSAAKLMGKRLKALSFLTFVVGRFAEVGYKQGLGSFNSMVRMVRYSISGQYPNLPWRTSVSLVGALLYFATPIDIIPDLIPMLGFLDDAFLLSRIFALAERDLLDFLIWEEMQAEQSID